MTVNYELYKIRKDAVKDYLVNVFEDRELRRISRPKGEQVTGGKKNICNVKLHYLYSAANSIRVIKSRKMTRTK
jgi:hypothetical protein